MKPFAESIKKSIKSFDEFVTSEEKAILVIDFHENQWIAQEENWNGRTTNTYGKLWNQLLEKISKQYPHLIED